MEDSKRNRRQYLLSPILYLQPSFSVQNSRRLEPHPNFCDDKVLGTFPAYTTRVQRIDQPGGWSRSCFSKEVFSSLGRNCRGDEFPVGNQTL